MVVNRKLDRHEHYTKKFDQVLPKRYHRGDLASAKRLQGYCDAIYATCATFLVLPLRNLHLETHEAAKGNGTNHYHGNGTGHHHDKHGKFTLNFFLEERTEEFIMFFVGFFLICTLWETQYMRFLIVKRLDDFITFLVGFSVLCATILPFSLALKGHFPEEHAGGLITALLIGSYQIIEVCISLYAFYSPRLLDIELHEWDEKDLKYLRNITLAPMFINLFFSVLVALSTLTNHAVTWVAICLVILFPLVRKLIFYLRRHRFTRQHNADDDRYNFFWELSKSNVDKERVEVSS